MFGPRSRARRAGAPATLCAWAVTELRPRSAFSYDLGDFLRSRWRHLNTMAASAPASARPQDRPTRRALRARRLRGSLHLCYAGPPCRANLRAGTFVVGMARREEQSAPQSHGGKSTVRHARSSTSVTKLQLVSSSFSLSPMTRLLDQLLVQDWPSGTAHPAPQSPARSADGSSRSRQQTSPAVRRRVYTPTLIRIRLVRSKMKPCTLAGSRRRLTKS